MSAIYNIGYAEQVIARYPWISSLDLAWKPGPALCQECGFNVGQYVGSARAVVEKGRVWPDILGHGGVGPGFFVSERIVTYLNQDPRMTGKFEAGPVHFVEILSKVLKRVPAPRYFYLNLMAHAEIDFKLSKSAVEKACELCGREFQRKRPPIGMGFQPDLNSWDGTPVFEVGVSRGRIIWCSSEFKEHAEKSEWTNINFFGLGEPIVSLPVQ